MRMLRSTGGALGAFGGKCLPRDLWMRDEAKLTAHFPAQPEDAKRTGRAWDWSAADSALMFHLSFWTGRDLPRMDRLFRQSALMRPKWDEHPTYARSTMTQAAIGTKSVYQQPQKAAPVPTPVATSDGVSDGIAIAGMMTVEEQVEHFKGCVYIEAEHKVLMPHGGLVRPDAFKASMGGALFIIDFEGKKTPNAFQAFTENRVRQFARAKDTIWDPTKAFGEIVDGNVNVYKAPVVTATPGDVSPYLDILARLIPDERDREIYLNWVASAVQNPGHKFLWAPVVQGTEGNGKSFLSDMLRHAIGHTVCHPVNAQNIAEKYNSFLEHNLLIVVEEIHMSGRREILDQLKDWITSPFVEIRRMGRDKVMRRTYANWYFNTNWEDAVMKTANDRRYCMFMCPQQSFADIAKWGMDGDYFPDLWDWARNGGTEAITHFLRTYPLNPDLDPAGKCHRAPVTTTTNQAIESSRSPVQIEIMDAIEEELEGFRGGWVSSFRLQELIETKRLRASKRSYRKIMAEMGYELCPALSDGRADKMVFQDGQGKPRLYCKTGLVLDPAKNATDQYMEAQGWSTPTIPKIG